MAKFDPPFSSDGENRLPTTDEQNDGFTCGPADQRLFNGLYRRIEAELRSIQDAGGISGSDVDDTTVLQAIQALIAAATGGGDTSQYVLYSQARARLPIFPEVLTSDGKFGVLTPATGQLRVPAGVSFLHRGIYGITTAQQDIVTSASKIYHLRWIPTGGANGTFALKDLSDVAYNPGALAETDPSFDSKYDDMLVARIITNSSNVLTITNLVNKNTLFEALMVTKSVTRTTSSITGGAWVCPMDAIPVNWARTPKYCASFSRVGLDGSLSTIPEEPRAVISGSLSDGTGTVNASADRYSLSAIAVIDTNTASVSRTFEVQMSASWQA